jgi:site-specific DNA recombinase
MRRGRVARGRGGGTRRTRGRLELDYRSDLRQPSQVTAVVHVVRELGTMRAAIYCRLSKNRKGTKANVKEQERTCREFVEAQGWQLVAVYVDDGISASDKSEKPREQFPLLMDDLRAGLIDVIVATEFTRFYRRPRELEELLDPVDKFHYESELYTIDPRVHRWEINTAVGRAALRAAVNQAAEYSDYISEKVRTKARNRARDGRWHGGDPGYGFDYVPAVRDSEGYVIEDEQVLINEPQAATVREVVRRRLSGGRMHAICDDLNRRGVLTRDGRQWRQGNLHPILTKPAIAGLVYHPELPELVQANWGTSRVPCLSHPDATDCWGAIVSEHDWRKLQAELSKPGKRTNFVGARTALLTGYVYCGVDGCGKKLVASRDSTGKRVYVCKRDSHRQGCGKLKRLADPVDQLVTELVIATLEDSEFGIPVADDDEFGRLWEDKRALEDSLAQLAIDHYRLRVIGRPAFLAAHEALGADLAAVQRKLDRASTYRNVTQIPVGEVAQQEWDAHQDDLAWRRELIGMLIDRVVIKPSRHPREPFSAHFGARFDPDSVDVVPRKLAASRHD